MPHDDQKVLVRAESHWHWDKQSIYWCLSRKLNPMPSACAKQKSSVLLFLGHRALITNKTQTAVINILNLFILIKIIFNKARLPLTHKKNAFLQLRLGIPWMPEVFLSLGDGILRSVERNRFFLSYSVALRDIFPLLFRRSEREKPLVARVDLASSWPRYYTGNS